MKERGRRAGFWRSRRGQIVMPALLLFPTLMLFVYLIYETAKLSREKIRHQFAMDAALFVEMANYSDFMNRTAYVNGAFPMRIFDESYNDFNTECEGKTTNCQSGKSYGSLMFENGLFPHLGGVYVDHHTPEGDSTFATMTKWKIEYGYASHDACLTSPPDCQIDRTSNPNMNAAKPASMGSQALALFSINDAAHYYHSYDLAYQMYTLYYQVYSLLGSVEAAQFQVLQKLENGHQFLVKSWWLNTGDSDGGTLAGNFGASIGDFDHSIKVYCQQNYSYCGNQTPSGVGIGQASPACTHLQPFPQSPACDGATPIPKQDSGLFQLVFVDNPGSINAMSSGNNGAGANTPGGLALFMPWKYPATNYFGVDWGSQSGAFPDGGRPQLHSTISVGHAPGYSPGIWPDPTPKYQVRQFP